MLKVHVLTNNTVRKRSLLAEHGLSLLIETSDKKLLFDTGQSSVFIHNANKLGLSLTDIDAIILSHGHYDHCGGLINFDNPPNIYLHQDILFKKYRKKESYIDIGVPFDMNRFKDKLIFNNKPLFIDEGVLLSGEIPCINDFENKNNKFYIKRDGVMIEDNILDEQMLIIEEKEKIAIFLGCSHRGVINSVSHAKKLFPNKGISLLVAGMHLENVSSNYLNKVISSLKQFSIDMIVPLHCTGNHAINELKKNFGKRCKILNAGDKIEI